MRGMYRITIDFFLILHNCELITGTYLTELVWVTHTYIKYTQKTYRVLLIVRIAGNLPNKKKEENMVSAYINRKLYEKKSR